MIYLDNAATTRTAPEVVEAMLPFFTESFGNPSSVYQLAAKSKQAIARSREQIASLLGAKGDEIFFTSGGSESDNWALKAAFESFAKQGNHIITTKIEHPAVLRTCEYLERERGAQVTYLDVDADGRVNPADVEQAITAQTILISVMTANNEIGTIEPIAEIGAIAHRHGIVFHTDAVQAYGQIPLDVDAMNIDLLSASGHKLNGPKGIGFLYIRKNIKLRSFLHGGAQERNRRAGTENVPAIVGFGAAAARAGRMLAEKCGTETALRTYLIEQLAQKIPNIRVNGSKNDRLPNNVNISFEFVEGESMLIMLDMKGICVSSGSACSSGSLSPSHVLKAIGLSDSLARAALRFTLSEETTRDELDAVVRELVTIVQRLRAMSPKYEAYQKGDTKAETSDTLAGEWI